MVQKFSFTCSRVNGSFTSGALSCPLMVGLITEEFWPMKCDWKRPASLPCQSMERSVSGSPGCPNPATAKVKVHTRMEELRGPSSLQSQAGALEGSCCGKSVVSTGDFARKSTKNFCCVKFLSFSLLPEPKLVYLGCSAKLQFPVQVLWGLTRAGMQSRKTRNKGRLQLGWRKPQPF